MKSKEIGDRKKNDDIVPEQPQETSTLTKSNTKKDSTEQINQFGREYDT